MVNKPRRSGPRRSGPRRSGPRQSQKRRQGDIEETLDDVVAGIEAEIEAEESERLAALRASGHRWAPRMESLFWLAMLATALMVCSVNKLPQGVLGMSALSASLNFVAAYAIHRGKVVDGDRFPVAWLGRSGPVNGFSFCLGVGLFSVGMMAFAVYREVVS
jgi:hypothetical protein